MKSHNSAPLAAFALLLTTSLSSHAALSAYSQNFETLAQASPTALGADGWKIFGNVFNPDGSYVGGYGVFAAPNGTPGFSSIANGQGGAAQGNQQLVVYSDYNNRPAQTSGQKVEALVFQEQSISAADVGKTWNFQFDAKHGDLTGASTAFAFIKTLNPSAGFATTNYVPLNMAVISPDWNRYSVSLAVDTPLVGQLLQFGFAATATNDIASGTFYDNVAFAVMAPVPEPETYAMLLAGLVTVGSLVRRSSSRQR